MSQTFTLKGYTSELTAYFYPPIKLSEKYEYSLALIGFYTYNSIPNIEDGLNKFHYVENGVKKAITIPTGAYEIEDIENYLHSHIEKDVEKAKKLLTLTPNNNTLKCEILSAFEIDFTPTDSIGRILGYTNKKLAANKLHESDLPVNILKVTTIRTECNIIRGSYYNSNSSHTLYEFSPTADPGCSINIEPQNLIFLPLNTNTIDTLSLRIVDQNSELINFRGEEIVVRLELRKKLWD